MTLGFPTSCSNEACFVAGSSPAAPASALLPIFTTGAAAADINSFNRLLKPAGKRNPPPAEDGIHDPGVDGTHALMAPLAAYATLPKSNAGNRVDWVKAMNDGKINPRWDRENPKEAPVVIDLNIVREVKGSMPDVVYPHKQHTEWLDCSNCHPAIFTPQKGANVISMAAILLGEKCGVCHGKVAFPVAECRLCHSKKKDVRPAQAAAPAK
jgi:c(7)-type cytochrome triheme protein